MKILPGSGKRNNASKPCNCVMKVIESNEKQRQNRRQKRVKMTTKTHQRQTQRANYEGSREMF